jgi:hypothetical protein
MSLTPTTTRAAVTPRKYKQVSSRDHESKRFKPQLQLAAPYRREVPLMNRRIAHAAQIVAVVLALVLVPAALAAKGGNGGGGSASGGSGGSLSLAIVADANSDGLPSWGDAVTFNVATTATEYPSVEADCYQNGTSVYTHSAGFYPTYPWPQSQTFKLQSSVWTAGAADCTAKLYYMNSRNKAIALTTLSFHVNA